MRLRQARVGLLALVLLSVLLPTSLTATARADSYEWDRMQRVLRDNALELAELPEGKRIAFIRVVRDEVFVEDEVWPTFLNWFHGTTREEVVRRELLFVEGDPYTDARVEESMRNLRGMAIFALVRIVAVQTSEPNAVGVVVHTRDLWSLRAETGFNFSNIVDALTLRLTERNFLGRNKALAAEFVLLPRSYRMEQQFLARRVWGSTVQLQEAVGVVFNRDTREAEGTTWLLKFGEPYFNLKQRWSWVGSFKYDNYIARRLSGREILLFPYGERDDPDGPHAQRLWRQQVGYGYVGGYLRLGERFKQTWGMGWDVRYQHANPVADTMLVPELRDAFAAYLPRNRTESGPAVSYDILIPQFQKFVNLTTFGQTENVRVGPSASLTSRVPLRAFGSNTNSWVYSATAGYVLALRGFLVEASVSGRMRYERQRVIDQRLEAVLRGATPVLFRAFRFVSRMTWDGRQNDSARTFVTLGSSNGLRGYTSGVVGAEGGSKLLANFELRSLPIEWQAVHVGAVLFYDTGSVYTATADIKLHHAVGIGLRVLLPQFNRTPFSFDGAAGFDPPFRFVPTIKDAQVVPLTASEDPVGD